MQQVAFIFPHQLFKKSIILDLEIPIYLIEEYLFFNQYKFHKQKLVFHRATMKHYEQYLLNLGKTVHYIEATQQKSDVRVLIQQLIKNGTNQIHSIDPTDNWLEKHINQACKNIEITWYYSPLFINTKGELASFFKPTKNKFFQTSFYKQQRKSRNILMVADVPQGGNWTYDADNRKKYPKTKQPPNVYFPEETKIYKEAKTYVTTHFSKNYGAQSQGFIYPTSFKEAEDWFEQFLNYRFHEFGPYEDAIVDHQLILNHSLLSPLINVGLLQPEYVIEKAIAFAEEHKVPINSTEGFVRQIIGWREFIRGVYEVKGTEERTKNYWGFSRKIPASFYNGTTGITPVDDTIKKVLKTGYAHHIERLMILGNFMVLCEFDPDEVYQWFMELFIDAYDWVMVPNVYGMSLFADGGIMSTKPYISGSNYLMKMSNYKKDNWQATWDGLFWTFMDKHRTFFLKNPRLSMLIRSFDKMDKQKQENHFLHAEKFLNQLDNG